MSPKREEMKDPITYDSSNVKNSRVSNTSGGNANAFLRFLQLGTGCRRDIARVAIVTREDQGRGFRSRWSFLGISVKFAWARIGMVASVWTRHKQREREERERGRKIRSRVYTGAWKQGECAFNIAEHLQSYLLPLPINTVDGASQHSRALFSATLAASRIIHFWSNCSHLPCRDLVEGTIEDGKGTTRGEAIRERFRDSIVLYLEQSKCLLARDSKKCCVHAEGYKARIFMLCRMTL